MANPDIQRQKLDPDRNSITRRFEIRYLRDGKPDVLKLYVIAGMYPDGRLGELFIRADRVGSFLSGALDTVAMMLSLMLQYGIPLEVVLDKLRHQRFEPSGWTGDKEFPSCSSPFDLVAQWLHQRFGVKRDSDAAAPSEATS